MYLRPDPTGPPAKKRNGFIIFGNAPPLRSSTTPERASTTRVAGLRARAASPSHSSQSRARKSSPAGELSVFDSPVALPEYPTPLALINTAGGADAPAMADARLRVGMIRLS